MCCISLEPNKCPLSYASLWRNAWWLFINSLVIILPSRDEGALNLEESWQLSICTLHTTTLQQWTVNNAIVSWLMTQPRTTRGFIALAKWCDERSGVVVDEKPSISGTFLDIHNHQVIKIMSLKLRCSNLLAYLTLSKSLVSATFFSSSCSKEL